MPLLQKEKAPGMAEVNLGHFAAICSMTEEAYRQRMKRLLENGELLELLKPHASLDVRSWIAHKEFLNGSKFGVAFRLSLNKIKDDMLYCMCHVVTWGDCPLLKVVAMDDGLAGDPPKDMKELEWFEVVFCDMATTIV